MAAPLELDFPRCTFIAGASGEGKSQTVRVVARRSRRRIYVDPNADYVQGIDAQYVIDSRAELVRILRRVREDSEFSIVVRPTEDEAKLLGFVCRCAWALRNTMVIADEAHDSAGHNERCDPFTIRYAKRARKRLGSLVIATQRPPDVNPSIRAECFAKEAFLFHLGDQRDYDTIREHKGREIADRVAKLQKLHCLRIDREGARECVIEPGDFPELRELA